MKTVKIPNRIYQEAARRFPSEPSKQADFIRSYAGMALFKKGTHKHGLSLKYGNGRKSKDAKK